MDVRLPDGTLIQGIPEGTTKEQLTAKLASRGYDVSTLGAGAPSQPAPQPVPGAPLTAMDKFQRGLRDPIDGGAQLLTNMLPKGLVEGGNKLNNWLADKTGMVGRLPEGGIDTQVRQGQAEYEAKRKAGGESGFDGMRMLGNVLNPASLAAAARIPQLASLGGRVAMGAGTGAGFGALTPVGEGDFASEKATQIGVGAAFGGALPAVAGGIARVISPNASKNANLQLLKSEGVRPTIGQTLGGAWNKTEEKLQSLPIMGDMIARARSTATSQFEAAAHNRALKPVGQKLPDGLSGRDAVVFTEQVLKDQYEDVLTRIGAIRPDAAFNTKIASLRSMVSGMMMPKAEKLKFESALNDVRSSIDANGVITSQGFKTLESSLGFDARKLAGSQNIYDGKIAPAVKQLQQELKNMLQRQAGPAADDLKSVNTGWANFKRVQNASSKLGAEDGQFTPAHFQNAVRTMDKSKDKSAFARGSALGQDLGDAGKSILTNKVPDAGTFGRAALGGGALASSVINPAIPASLIAGGAMYLSPMQRALVFAASNRGPAAQQSAEALRKASPMLIPGGAQFGLGLLDY